MNNHYTVYKHISPSNKIYIGITSRKPELRWRKGNGYYNNKHFYNAIQKYGWNNIKHEILFERLSNNRNFGYNIENGGNCSITATEGTKKKISKGNKGKVVSKETREKISRSTKGKRLGGHRSKETREKIRENSGRNIKVCQYSLEDKLINIFNSQKEAARKLNIDSSSIVKCCKKKVKTAGGYVWKYLNKKEEKIHND